MNSISTRFVIDINGFLREGLKPGRDRRKARMHPGGGNGLGAESPTRRSLRRRDTPKNHNLIIAK